MGKVDVRRGQWIQQSATEISEDVWAMDAVLINPDNGEAITVQNPLPTDGDSVYCKDIWIEESELNNFSGSVCDLFDNLHTVITDSTSNNPKELFVHFNRTIPNTVLGLGAFTGNFSNVKIIALTSGNVELIVADETSDDTKYTSRQFDIPSIGYNGVIIQFHTADPVSLSNLFISKTRSTVSRIQGQKPGGDFVEFQATNSGNFKVSLEELENDISVNGNTQLRTTLFDSGGVEAHVDDVASTLQTIDFVHHEIHEGDHYFVTNWVELDATETFEYVIQTPNTTTKMHSGIIFQATGQVEVDAFEGTTAGVDGTQVIPFNSNRNSSNTAEVIIRTNPTITADGTFLYSLSLGSGTNPANTTGGDAGREDELILKVNTKYLVRFTSNTASNRINYRFFWYEHVDSN